MSNDNNTVVDSKVALSLFLDSLLKETEIQEEVVTEEPVVKEATVSLVEVELPEVKQEVEVKVDTTVPVEVEQEVVTETIVEPEVVVETKVAVEPETQLSAAEEEVEPETDEPFQVLLFKVAGLTLAVRLVELNGVLDWDESALTEMPGHSQFYLGVYQYLGKSIPVIDTARLVFPADKLISLSADKPYERVKRIVLIDDSKWGLACDEIAEVIELTHESVKWRQNRSKHKWMAGTVIDHMCALVDASGFAEMLEDGTHNRK